MRGLARGMGLHCLCLRLPYAAASIWPCKGLGGGAAAPLACWLVVAFNFAGNGLAKRKLALAIYIAFGQRIFENYAAISRGYKALAIGLKILGNAQLAIMQHKAKVAVVMQANAGAFIAVVEK